VGAEVSDSRVSRGGYAVLAERLEMKIAKCSELPVLSVDGYALLPNTLAWWIRYERTAERLTVERVIVLHRRPESRECVVVAPAFYDTPGKQDSHAVSAPICELHVSDDSAVSHMSRSHYLPLNMTSSSSFPSNSQVVGVINEVKP
jgi:hypothetical protein